MSPPAHLVPEGVWDQLVFYAVFYGIQPLLAFVRADSFLYWPFVLSFFLLAALLAWRFPEQVKGAFSGRLWWSPSARADYLYYLVNGILFPAFLGSVLFGVVSLGTWFSQGLESVLGAPPNLGLGDGIVVWAYTLVYFLFYDFGRFLAHWIQHKNPWLWQFHQVHHSAEVLTPITSFRVHPVDLLVMGLGETLFAAMAYGLFAWLFPGQFGFFLVLGTHVLLLAYRFLGNLRHSHVWLSYGPLNRLLVSPAMHQIHHSTLARHRDRNMGFALSIWDQLFGCAYLPKQQERFTMGLGDGQDDGRWHHLGSLYLRPFLGLFRKLVGRRADGA